MGDAVDYSVGKYVVYSALNDGQRVGWVEAGGLIMSDNKLWKFKIDGAEIRSMKGELIGSIDSGIATRTSGQRLFIIALEEPRS